MQISPLKLRLETKPRPLEVEKADRSSTGWRPAGLPAAQDELERTQGPAQTAPRLDQPAPLGTIPAGSLQQRDFSAGTGAHRARLLTPVAWNPSGRSDPYTQPMRAVDVGGRHVEGPKDKVERPDLAKITATKPSAKDSGAITEDFGASGNLMMHYSGAEEQAHMIKRMAKVGRKEGFGIIATADPGLETELKKKLGPEATNVTITPHTNELWTEDALHPRKDGTGTVPPDHNTRDANLPAIEAARLQRMHPELDVSKLGKDEIRRRLSAEPGAFGYSGAVGDHGGGDQMKGFLSKLGRDVKTAKTYVEGGNVVHLTKDGKTHALVGRDAFARNEARGLKEPALSRAMAKDLGVDPKNLHPIEQPGEFHLDMAIASWGDGRVLLNDSRAAAELQIKAQNLPADRARWLREQAEGRAKYEQKAKAELQAAGFNVVSVPGRFFKPGSNGESVETANFLNGEPGSNKNGGRYFVTQRGDRKLEDGFLASLPKNLPVRVYFAFDAKASSEVLENMGAANCLVKRFH